MLTNGEMSKNRPHEKLSVISADLKNKGVHVYVVGIGSDISSLELQEMASADKVITVPSFDVLLELSVQLREQFCKGEYQDAACLVALLPGAVICKASGSMKCFSGMILFKTRKYEIVYSVSDRRL